VKTQLSGIQLFNSIPTTSTEIAQTIVAITTAHP
jgi:hypothetical protein